MKPRQRHGSYEKELDENYQRAASIDNIVLTYLKEVAAFKKYGLERLVAACACAAQGRRHGYNEVKDILDKGEDADFLSPDNIGGQEAPSDRDGICSSPGHQEREKATLPQL